MEGPKPKDPSSKCVRDESSLMMRVSGILTDKRVCELMIENKELRDRLQFVEDALKKTCGHADDLVWYARRQNTHDEEWRERLNKKYPEELKAYEECDTNWQHGFNSGCLAVYRLVSEILHADETAKEFENNDDCDYNGKRYIITADSIKQQAVDNFPSLDT